MIFMGDSLTKNFKQQHYRLDDCNYAQCAGGLPHTRHREMANILFGDNHVSLVRGMDFGDAVKAPTGWTWITQDCVSMGAYSW
jgi:prepilin-type processing-associated H-X9-DG protein